ncbi:MAG: YitT family protein [Anaerolineaceae bacterium]
MQNQPISQPSLLQRAHRGFRALDFSWRALEDYAFILLGSLVQAVSLRLFLVPAQLVSGGISGAAQIINFYTHWPIGLMVFIGNAPLFILGWRFLGGRRFALRTAAAIIFFSFFTDFLTLFIPAKGITQDLVLNSLYGGITLGIGLGLVYRGRGTSGGSDILARILNNRLSIPLSQSYMITDTLVVLAGGFAFNWERALYGLIVIYVSGLVAEMVSEGSSIFRTAMIITSQPDEVSRRVIKEMVRGLTILPGTGAYTGTPRPVLYCVITRPEVNQLKELVREVDPQAFMVIGIAHEALGEGFKPLVDKH